MALTDPNNYAGEIYDTNEMKIDQLKKFLSTYAYRRDEKKEKKLQWEFMEYRASKNPNTVICGRKSGNICLIVFADDDWISNFNKFDHLPEHFKTDSVTLAWVHGVEEHYMKA